MLEPGPEDQRRQITVEQAEADYFASIDLSKESRSRRAILSKPFGFGNDDWEKIKAMMQPGDELWECCTDESSWDRMMGMHHLELIRNGEQIGFKLLKMN